MVKVLGKQQNTEVPCKKYRIQVRPSSTEGIQNEEKHNLTKCSDLTPRSMGLLDTLTNNAAGLMNKGIMGKVDVLDNVAYNQTDVQDQLISLPTDIWDVTAECTKASDISGNIPSGHDSSLLMKTTGRTPLLDSIREQSFLIDFKDAISQSR